jgi:hypothetical protein
MSSIHIFSIEILDIRFEIIKSQMLDYQLFMNKKNKIQLQREAIYPLSISLVLNVVFKKSCKSKGFRKGIDIKIKKYTFSSMRLKNT